MKKTARPNSCNVLSLGADARVFWRFNTGGGKVALAHESAGPLNGPLPTKDVAKDWRDLLQPKLNIAWLPADQVFLRVVHLPAADTAELRAMLELQVEKLSPLPLAQTVWSFEPLPKGASELQTVIVICVARATVEQFLGRLEGQGYMPDRLEVPAIHELMATPAGDDGVWLYPRISEGRVSCLVAWWYGGVLRDLGLVNVSNDATAAAMLSAHIGQMAWAGELEGWLTAPPRWYVVATPETANATAALWQTDEPLQLVEPPAPRAVAEWSAGKGAGGQSLVNLLPAEYGTRYRQQYVDRLWMRALAAAIGLYVLGVAAYFAWFGVVKYQATGVAARAAALSLEYTNTVKIKQQGDILQEQSNLRFAALDTWRLISENLPDGLKLSSMNFSRGKSVSLFGDAPMDNFDRLADFNAAMARASLASNGAQFFTNVSPPQSQQRPPVISWSFNLDLSGAEIP